MKLILIFALMIVIGSCDASRQSNVYTGTVTKIHDGDSIWLQEPGEEYRKIRLKSVDSPELQQQYGIQSRDILRSILLDRRATAVCDKKDQYNRHICVVYENETDINLLLIKSGAAWHSTKYVSEQSFTQAREYAKAEKYASENRFGLWAGTAEPPWEYRKRR